MNCFCTYDALSIADVTDRFSDEFKANSDWLKFAFHAEDSSTYYNSDKVEEISASYDKFVSAIYKMTGATDCIDRIARLGFYTGTLNNVKAIRDCNCGIVGLLTAEDDRNSYYLDSTKESYVKSHGRIVDYENGLTLLRTHGRLESNLSSNLSQYLGIEYGNSNRYIEFFTHEYILSTVSYNYWPSLKTICEWAKDNDYSWGFMQNVLKL